MCVRVDREPQRERATERQRQRERERRGGESEGL